MYKTEKPNQIIPLSNEIYETSFAKLKQALLFL